MECEFCRYTEDKESVIYEDDDLLVVVKDLVFAAGQITVIPKQHYTIMELVPETVLSKCVKIANKVGMAVFETLGCQGTNIIIQNGVSAGQTVPHFAIEIVPRMENDQLNLKWEPKQLMEDELESTSMVLGNAIQEVERSVQVEPAKKKEPEKILDISNSDNYLLKSIRRMP